MTSSRRERDTFSHESGRYAVLYPAIAEAAHRVGATAVGLIDAGRPAGLNLNVDNVGIRYSDGMFLGVPESAVQRACVCAKRSSVPGRSLPAIVSRVVVDRLPLDVGDPEVVRGLVAGLPPEQSEDAEALRAELLLAASLPRELLAGDYVDLLPEAVARVPTGALPVVITTWTLSRLKPARRLRFWERLEESTAGRPVAWISVEGVGVAPNVPMLGDRPASGHSIVGLALFDGSAWSVEALGRCWSRGNLMQWIAPEVQ